MKVLPKVWGVMKALSLLCVSILLLVSSPVFAADWSYQGETGPESWGKLDPDNILCAIGKNQSPVNITQVTPAKLDPINLSYLLAPNTVINTGHTITVSFQRDSQLSLGDTNYELQKVHFHTPSETQIKGQSFPLEAQFVHSTAAGQHLVLTVLFTNGPSNPALTELIKQTPNEGYEKAIQPDSALDFSDLLPQTLDYYRYNGSLTMPPCTEGVVWLVLKQSLTVGADQVAALGKAMNAPNNRPVQPLNARLIVE